jgi:hypothetical protein
MDNIIGKLTKFADRAEAKKAWDSNENIPGTKYITHQGYMREIMENEGYPSGLIVHKEQLDEKELDEINKKAKVIFIEDYTRAKDLEKKLQKLYTKLEKKEITLNDYKTALTGMNEKLDSKTAFRRLEYYAKLGADLVKGTKKAEADKNIEQYEHYRSIIDSIEAK